MATIELGDNYDIEENSGGDLVVKDSAGNVVLKHDESADEWRSINSLRTDEVNNAQTPPPSEGAAGINAAMDVNGHIKLEPGVYECHEPVVVDHVPITIEGSHEGTVLERHVDDDPIQFASGSSLTDPSSDPAGISSDGDSRVSTLQNLRLDGRKGSQSGGDGIQTVDKQKFWTFRNLWIHDFDGHGIHNDSSFLNAFENIVLWNNDGSGIRVDEASGGSAGKLQINNVHAGENGSDGFHFASGNNIKVTNCFADQNNSRHGFNVAANNIYLLNINAEGAGNDGVHLESGVSGFPRHVVVMGKMSDCGDRGLDAIQGSYLTYCLRTTSSGIEGLRVTSVDGPVFELPSDFGTGATRTGPVVHPTQQSAISSLTDNTGGSTDGTLAAVSGSSDDSTINNNFAELQSTVDAILQSLRDTGHIDT